MGKRWHLFRVKRLSITKIAEFFKIVLIPPINLSECLYIKDSFEIHPSHNPPVISHSCEHFIYSLGGMNRMGEVM